MFAVSLAILADAFPEVGDRAEGACRLWRHDRPTPFPNLASEATTGIEPV
jgi:hypothetical protein